MAGFGFTLPGQGGYSPTPTGNSYGFTGGGAYGSQPGKAGLYANSQIGDAWALPTGNVMQQQWDPKTNAWTANDIGKTFDAQRWGDVMGMMKDAMGSFSSQGGSLGGQIPPPSLPGRSAAPTWTPDEGVNAQAFARAKDNVGRMIASGQRDVKDLMGARGIGNSGLEAKALAQLRNEGLRSLAGGELNRAVANEGRQFDMAKLGAQLGTTERGQDIAGQGNLYSTQVTQRGQTDPRLQILTSLMSSIGGLY